MGMVVGIAAAAAAPADRPRGGSSAAAGGGMADSMAAAEEGRRWLKVCRMPADCWAGGGSAAPPG